MAHAWCRIMSNSCPWACMHTITRLEPAYRRRRNSSPSLLLGLFTCSSNTKAAAQKSQSLGAMFCAPTCVRLVQVQLLACQAQ